MCLQDGNLQIVSFAAYGYNQAWDSLSALFTPCVIPDSSTWGFSDVQFTEDEFEDYVSRFFCELHLGLKDGDSKVLQQYVAHTTGYHPRLVACFMDKIRTVLSLFVGLGELTFERIFCYLNSYAFYVCVQYSN